MTRMPRDPNTPPPHEPRNNPSMAHSPPERAHHALTRRAATPTKLPRRPTGHAAHERKRKKTH